MCVFHGRDKDLFTLHRQQDSNYFHSVVAATSVTSALRQRQQETEQSRLVRSCRSVYSDGIVCNQRRFAFHHCGRQENTLHARLKSSSQLVHFFLHQPPPLLHHSSSSSCPLLFSSLLFRRKKVHCVVGFQPSGMARPKTVNGSAVVHIITRGTCAYFGYVYMIPSEAPKAFQASGCNNLLYIM